MNGIIHVYVASDDFMFIDWAKRRFGRNFSRAVINALKEYVGEEWNEKRTKKPVETVGPDEL